MRHSCFWYPENIYWSDNPKCWEMGWPLLQLPSPHLDGSGLENTEVCWPYGMEHTTSSINTVVGIAALFLYTLLCLLCLILATLTPGLHGACKHRGGPPALGQGIPPTASVSLSVLKGMQAYPNQHFGNSRTVSKAALAARSFIGTVRPTQKPIWVCS